MGDGVRREWFRLLVAELADPLTGLLESHDAGATFAPAPHSSVQQDDEGGSGASGSGGHLPKFELVGCMLGLALLHGCTLPGLRLTPATWRLALGLPVPEPEAALAAADPALHRGLCLLRTLRPADVAALGLHFETHDALGRTVSRRQCVRAWAWAWAGQR